MLVLPTLKGFLTKFKSRYVIFCQNTVFNFVPTFILTDIENHKIIETTDR